MSEGPYTDAQQGNMPASQLTTLTDANGNPIQLQHNTADAWAVQVARNSALTISPLGGYRTTTQSNSIGAYGQSHGYGTCVDIYMSSANQWAIDNFPSSWVRDLWVAGRPQNAANEWNHWHYVGPLNTSSSSSGSSIDFGEEMKIAIVNQSGTYVPFLIMPGRYRQLADVSLVAYRNGQPKSQGPLGVEYDWTQDQFNTATRGFVPLSSSTSGPFRSLTDDDVAAIVAAMKA